MNATQLFHATMRAVAIGWCTLATLTFGAVMVFADDLATVAITGVAMVVSTLAACSVAVAK